MELGLGFEIVVGIQRATDVLPEPDFFSGSGRRRSLRPSRRSGSVLRIEQQHQSPHRLGRRMYNRFPLLSPKDWLFESYVVPPNQLLVLS